MTPSSIPDMPTPDEGLPDIDMDDSLERLEGDRDLLAELAGMVIAELPQLLTDLRRAVMEQDAFTLRRRAHSLAGMAGNLSAVALESLSRQLGPAALAGDWVKTSLLIDRVEDRCRAFASLFPGLPMVFGPSAAGKSS